MMTYGHGLPLPELTAAECNQLRADCNNAASIDGTVFRTFPASAKVMKRYTAAERTHAMWVLEHLTAAEAEAMLTPSVREVRECPRGHCSWEWTNAHDSYQACPECDSRMRPLVEFVKDPEAHMPPGWVWDPMRGHCGMWRPESEYMRTRALTDAEREELFQLLGGVDNDLWSTIIARLREANEGKGPRVNAAMNRAAMLADECQLLADQLRDKRAECDELRDRLNRRR